MTTTSLLPSLAAASWRERLRALLGSWPGRAGLALAGLFAVLTGLLTGQDAALSTALRPLDGDAHAHAALSVLKVFGRGEVLVLLACLVGALGRGHAALRILLAGLILAVVVTALKHGIGRIRPNDGALSFPSGDTATAFALVLPIAYAWRAYAVPLLLLALGVGLGRVVQGWHWPSDAAAGAALGLLAGAAACVAMPDLRLRRGWWLLAGLAFASAALLIGVLTGESQPDLRRALLVFAPVTAALLAWIFLRGFALPFPLPFSLPRWRLRTVLLVGLLVAGLLYAAVAARSSLWDRDEPRNAAATLEMVEDGAFLVPTLNGEWRLHKPILPYWGMHVGVLALGPTPLAVRLPAILAALLTAALLAYAGARVHSARAGVFAAAILLTTPLLLVSGTAATTDALLLCGIVAAIALFAAQIAGPRAGELVAPALRPLDWRFAPLAGLALAAAQLAKGPVGLAVPLFALLGTVLILRPPQLGSQLLRIALATLIGFALFLAWFLPANTASEGALLREAFFKHVVARGTTSSEGHSGGFWYYLPVLFGTFLPWTLFLPATLIALWRGRIGDVRLRVLILAWALPPLLLFSCYATKLPHYILPIFPALALAVAAYLVQRGMRPAAEDALGLALGRWLMIPLAALAGLALIAGPALGPERFVAGLPPLAALVPGGIACGLCFLLIAAIALRERRPQRAAVGLLCGFAGLIAAAALTALPGTETWKIAPQLARVLAATAPPGIPIATMDRENLGFNEPSLYFSLYRPGGQRPGALGEQGSRGPALPSYRHADDFLAWAEQPGPGAMLITTRMLAEVTHIPPHLRELGRVSGFNYSNGRALTVVLFGRGLPP